MDVDRLRVSSLAVVGLGTTTAEPPLILHVVVFYLTDGLITAGPFSFWVAPDMPLGEVPVRWRPNIRLAAPWPEVAGRLVEILAGRTVVVHQPARLEVLRRHLPDWQPAGTLFTRELAELLWPGLDGYDLDPLTARTTRHQIDRVGPGAAAEAHAVALLLGALFHAARNPPPRPAHLRHNPDPLAARRITDGTDHRGRDRPPGRAVPPGHRRVLGEQVNTDGVCLACGGEAWPCHRAELAEHNHTLCQPAPPQHPAAAAPGRQPLAGASPQVVQVSGTAVPLSCLRRSSARYAGCGPMSVPWLNYWTPVTSADRPDARSRQPKTA